MNLSKNYYKIKSLIRGCISVRLIWHGFPVFLTKLSAQQLNERVEGGNQRLGHSLHSGLLTLRLED